jgi:1-acyl-sn-glycerol-3-phosphate acyltransferase
MLYAILRLITKIATRIFFKSLQVKGQKNAPKKGALMVVANHPILKIKWFYNKYNKKAPFSKWREGFGERG